MGHHSTRTFHALMNLINLCCPLCRMKNIHPLSDKLVGMHLPIVTNPEPVKYRGVGKF